MALLPRPHLVPPLPPLTGDAGWCMTKHIRWWYIHSWLAVDLISRATFMSYDNLE